MQSNKNNLTIMVKLMPLFFVMLLGLTNISVPLIGKPCVQVVPGGAVELFWVQVKRGAEDAGRDYGYSIYFRGAKTSSDGKEQQRIVNMTDEIGCKALVLAPSANYDKDVARLHKLGIPVVFIDRSVGNTKLTSLVATNNYNAGYEAGLYMAERLGWSGRIVVLRLRKGVSSTDFREKGFIDAATNLGLTIIDAPYIGDNVAEGRKNTKDILSKYSGEIDGIFTPNETTSSSLLLALEQLTPNKSMVNIGFDVSQRLIDGLDKNIFTALVVQRPYRIGYVGVTTAINNIIEKGDVKFLDTGHILVTTYNIKTKSITDELKLNYPTLIIRTGRDD